MLALVLYPGTSIQFLWKCYKNLLPSVVHNIFNSFYATDLFLYPLKTLENFESFLMFSEGIEIY